MSVTLKGSINNITPANFTLFDSEAAAALEQSDIEKLNGHTEEFINNAVSENIEIITHGVLARANGHTELRYCEDIYSDGLPEGKTLTIIGFGENDPDTASFVRTATSDWRDFIAKMENRRTDEMLKRLLTAIFSTDDDRIFDDKEIKGDIEEKTLSDDETSGFDDEDDEMSLRGFDTAMIFSRKYTKSRIYFGTGSSIPARIVPGGGPSGFTLITEFFENRISFPDGGTIKIRYSIDSHAMTDQRGDITITAKPIH